MKKIFLLLPVLLLGFFLSASSCLADEAKNAGKPFQAGAYRCAGDNPGNFIFASDGSGLFATEEYIAYFSWKTEGKNLLLTFLKGKQDDKTLKMDLLGPDSFKFEKYVYKHYKQARLDKYKLVADDREGSLLVLSSDKPSRRGHVAYMYVNVKDNHENKLCEMEVACKTDGVILECKDNFGKRKKSGKMILKNFGTDEVDLESTISGSHNYQAACKYGGKYRLVKGGK